MNQEELLSYIEEIKNLEFEVKKLNDIIEERKNEIKTYMTENNITEETAGRYTIRYIPVITNRFDSKAFKNEHEILYENYMKSSSSYRFTITD